MKHFSKVLLIITVFVLALSFSKEAKAETLPISEISIFSGNNARENLDNSGLTPIEKNMNPVGGTKVYLGYATGGEPITGLMLSHTYTNILVRDGAAYRPVSNISLNDGTGAPELYLYFTKDPKAGTPVLTLHTVTNPSTGSVNFADYLNDGSDLLRMDDGNVANLEEGLAEPLYMDVVHKDIYRPYISELRLVKPEGRTIGEAILATGLNYYMEDFVPGTESDPVYIAFNRTADAEKALRFVFLADPEASFESGEDGEEAEELFTKVGEINIGGEKQMLYVSMDEDFGAPVCDLTAGSMMMPGFTYSSWAKICFNGLLTPARASLLNEDAYKAAEEDVTDCLENKVWYFSAEEDPVYTGLICVTEKTVDGWKTEKVIFAEEEEETEETEETDESDEAEESDGEDESENPEDEEETDENEDPESQDEESDETENPEESSEEETAETEESTDVTEETEEEIIMEDIEYEPIPDKDPGVEILYDGENTTGTPEFVGSAIGTGSLVAIACFLFAALLLSALCIIFSRKKRRAEK